MSARIRPMSGADAEAEARRLKHRAALGSVAATLALTLIKLVAGLLSGSLALLSEAAHGAVDTGATLVTFFAVQFAGKPADESHHFGHEKVEALAALFQAFVLLDVALVVVVEGARRIASGKSDVALSPWLFGVLVLSIGVDVFRWRALRRIAVDTGSEALAADAVHFSSDLFATTIVLGGLVLYAAGWTQADALASFGVAAFIAVAAVRLARRTVDTLLDAAPEGLAPSLRAIALAVPGVADVGEVRLRQLGGRTIGDLTVGISRTLSPEDFTAIRMSVVEALRNSDPKLDITIMTEPRTLDDESILQRVLLIAARRRLAIHHVTIQHLGEQVSISFDLELDGSMTHSAAHEIATALETAIQAEIGPDVEVESHIEPLNVSELEGCDERPERVAAIAERLTVAARTRGVLYDVHKVRARRTRDGLVVNYHCRIDPARSVEAVHACVDAVEHDVRAQDPEIVRIVGHAEPPRDMSDA